VISDYGARWTIGDVVCPARPPLRSPLQPELIIGTDIRMVEQRDQVNLQQIPAPGKPDSVLKPGFTPDTLLRDDADVR
jgi:hypothetical protein